MKAYLPFGFSSKDKSESESLFFFLLCCAESFKMLSSELMELTLGERLPWIKAEPKILPVLAFFTRFFKRSSSCSWTVFTRLISLFRRSNGTGFDKDEFTVECLFLLEPPSSRSFFIFVLIDEFFS